MKDYDQPDNHSSVGVWVPGMDAIIDLFDQYRKRGFEISRLADQLESCSPSQTSSYSAAVIRVSQTIPALQRQLEREESYREQILAKINAVADLEDQIYSYFDMLSERAQMIIIKRYYIDGLPMHKVAAELPYCVRRCWDIRTDAFRSMAEKSAR